MRKIRRKQIRFVIIDEQKKETKYRSIIEKREREKSVFGIGFLEKSVDLKHERNGLNQLSSTV